MCQLQMLLSITFVPLRPVLQFEFLSVSSRRKWISIYSPLQIATISFLRVLTKIIRNFYVSWTNKNEREELNNADKQIDTFQPSGASFDKQSVICLPTVGSHQTLERIFERRALSFAWLENNRAIVGRNISWRWRRSTHWNADADYAGGGICVAIFPPFWPAGGEKGLNPWSGSMLVSQAMAISICFYRVCASCGNRNSGNIVETNRILFISKETFVSIRWYI